MSTGLLMPKATAVWLVENTSLTFDQDRRFLQSAPARSEGYRRCEVATGGSRGRIPSIWGQLTREEIERAQKTIPPTGCVWRPPKVKIPEMNAPPRRGPPLHPRSRARQDRPNAHPSGCCAIIRN